jgi:hypothetical protein
LGAGILLALVLWTFPGWQGLWALIVLWIIGAFLLAFAVVAVLIRLRASQGPLWRALAAVGQATLGTLLLCPFILAFAGIGLEYHPRTHWELRRAQHEIGQAIQTFKAQTGGYPSRLADLTASSRPAMGLDASGNAVSLQAGATGPLLKRLPKDPLTGRRDTWIYDVLATPPVESGAFHLQVLRQPSP